MARLVSRAIISITLRNGAKLVFILACNSDSCHRTYGNMDAGKYKHVVNFLGKLFQFTTQQNFTGKTGLRKESLKLISFGITRLSSCRFALADEYM